MNNRIENAKIRFVESNFNEKNQLVVQLGFEVRMNKIVSSYKFVLDGEKMNAILDALEIRKWEDLPKKYARVNLIEEKVIEVGNILNEKWVKL